ncbi:MAG: hypothetical protein GY750_15365 [Lentisphaerae bacterium]|nr:hypothetical protein [Lentisphaerota bacterium]
MTIRYHPAKKIPDLIDVSSDNFGCCHRNCNSVIQEWGGGQASFQNVYKVLCGFTGGKLLEFFGNLIVVIRDFFLQNIAVLIF